MLKRHQLEDFICDFLQRLLPSTSLFLLAGVRFTSYHGNFMLRSTDLLALPAVDCDKAYAAQLSLEDTLLTTQTVYFQVALLYPSHYNPTLCYDIILECVVCEFSCSIVISRRKFIRFSYVLSFPFILLYVV